MNFLKSPCQAHLPLCLLFSLFLAHGLSACGDDDLVPAPDAAVPMDAGADLRMPSPDAGDSGPVPDTGPQPIENYLADVEGLEAIERSPSLQDYDATHRVFDLRRTVYVDPEDNTSERFEVHAVLFARRNGAREAPVVMITNGYALYAGGDSLFELTSSLSANQLAIEFRYFGDSTPEEDPAMLHLSSEAGANDVHQFVTALKPYFDGSWISTGRSRGGEVALHHRALYPGEVDGTVAYVTPNITGAPDSRYVDALGMLGDEDCRARLEALQRLALGTHREELWGSLGLIGFSFARIGGPEAALESIVQAVPMSFWQAYGDHYDCNTLPDPTSASVDDLWDFLHGTVGLGSATDDDFATFGAYYVLAHRQEGYPQMPIAHIADLLTTGAPSVEQGILPESVEATFDGTLDGRVDGWIATEAEHIIFLRGEFDSWSAVPHPVRAMSDIHQFTALGRGHDTSLTDLEEDDQMAAMNILNGWID